MKESTQKEIEAYLRNPSPGLHHVPEIAPVTYGG
jgi:hypothetical protein